MQALNFRRVAGSCLAFFVLVCGSVSPIQAGEFAYGLEYSIEHSDNITRVQSNEISEVTSSYLAGFAYLERTTDVIAHVLAQAEYLDYRDDVFDDEPIYNVDAYMIGIISPRQFTWTVEDRFEEDQIDATAEDTPDNRANVNVFSTGPDFYARFTPVNTLALGARIGNVSADDVNIDNDRLGASARWLYQATSISTYSLNFLSLDVNYDDSTVNTDFTRQDIFIRADYRPSRSQYIFDLGTSAIRPDGGEDLDGSLARFSWIRRLTQESSFGISASGEYSDTGTDILESVTRMDDDSTSAAGLPTVPEWSETGSGLSSNAITSDVYYAKRGEIFYNRRGGSFAVDFTANVSDLDFETAPEDRTEMELDLEIDFFYSGTFTVTLFSEWLKTDFQSFAREDTESDSGLRFNYRLSRTMSMELEGSRVDRTSTDPTVEFDEIRVFLSIIYSSKPLFVPLSR